MSEIAEVIRFENVTKSFPAHRGQRLLKSHLAGLLAGHERFKALKNISFSLQKGESLALIGQNGAGKSTLLSLVAGLLTPDSGNVSVSGRITPLLELGSGFHPELTGRENVTLNAAMLGFSRKEIARRFDEITDFAGIGDFIEEPLRTYSSGMMMRLAFAVAIHVDPDILLIDEILVVGDIAFQTKCFDKVKEFRRAGKTFLCASHSPGMIQALCDRAIWLDHGELMMAGPVGEVLAAYSGAQSSVQTA